MSHLERDNSKNHAVKGCGFVMESLRLWLVERNLENLYYWDLKSGEDFIWGYSTYTVLSKISNSMGKLGVKNELHFLFTDLGHLNSLSFCLFDYKVEIITVSPKGWAGRIKWDGAFVRTMKHSAKLSMLPDAEGEFNKCL